MSLKPVKYVIFDMDGLLLDTETIYECAFKELAAAYGKEYTDDIRIKVLGTVPIHSYTIITKELNIPLSPEEFGELAHVILREKMQNVALMRGAERLVQHLVKHQIPIAIATSSCKELFDIKMKNHQQFLKKFHHVVVGGSDPEVKRGKPAPDIYLICASRFAESPCPSDCLVFEDAPNGIRAAIDAGMQAVMVPEQVIPEENRVLATKVISSLLDFIPEEFSLPPF